VRAQPFHERRRGFRGAEDAAAVGRKITTGGRDAALAQRPPGHPELDGGHVSGRTPKTLCANHGGQVSDATFERRAQGAAAVQIWRRLR